MINKKYTYAVIGASRDPNKYGNKPPIKSPTKTFGSLIKNALNIEEIKNSLLEKGYIVHSKEEHENYTLLTHN